MFSILGEKLTYDTQCLRLTLEMEPLNTIAECKDRKNKHRKIKVDFTYLTAVRQLLLLVQEGFRSAKVVHKLPLQSDTFSAKGKK